MVLVGPMGETERATESHYGPSVQGRGTAISLCQWIFCCLQCCPGNGRSWNSKLGRLAFFISSTFTWVSFQKEHYCDALSILLRAYFTQCSLPGWLNLKSPRDLLVVSQWITVWNSLGAIFLPLINSDSFRLCAARV